AATRRRRSGQSAIICSRSAADPVRRPAGRRPRTTTKASNVSFHRAAWPHFRDAGGPELLMRQLRLTDGVRRAYNGDTLCDLNPAVSSEREQSTHAASSKVG